MVLILEYVKNKHLKHFFNEKINLIGNKETMKFCVKTKKVELYFSEEIDSVCLKLMNRAPLIFYFDETRGSNDKPNMQICILRIFLTNYDILVYHPV